MVKISPWAWLIIGLAMSLFSMFVQSKAEDSKLILFLVAGIVFVIIGIFKLVMRFITKEEKGTPPMGQAQSQPEDFDQLMRKKMIEQQLQAKSILACPRCGTRHYNTSNFCHLCGTKLK